MNSRTLRRYAVTLLSGLALVWGIGTAQAYLSPDYSNPDLAPGGATPFVIGPADTPDYLTTPNWAYTPPIRKFVDTLPGLGSTNANNLGQYIPVAVPDIVSYPGSDYYVIELREFTEQMHSDLPPTTLRAYRQINQGTVTSGGCTDPALGQANPCTVADNTAALEAKPRQFGPLIIAQKDRPVRVKFVNNLPTTALGGELFVPVDQTIMGAGPFQVDYDPVTKLPIPLTSGSFSQNRAEIHLHGGRTPWISDGTPHQWITPDGETTSYPSGVSMINVPDMPDPGPGAQTYYYTNQQSSRLMFYHDHSWGITRLNVYVGGAAGYLVRDAVEQQLIADGKLPAAEIPLIIQDKTFVDGDPASATYVRKTDPTWQWGTGAVGGDGFRTPQTGDLWWPHIYMPAQNPFDITGISPMGRWAFGPYFWPATGNPYQPIANPYYSPACDPAGDQATTPGLFGGFCQPPEIPATPNPSWGAEAFMDTPTVNGTAYPVLTVQPKAYRFRILNAAHDRFVNLSLFKADPAPAALDYSGEFPPNCADYTAPGYGGFAGICASNTEVKMVAAVPGGVGKPATWPEDGRPGGVPDWNTVGPNWIMIGNEGGFLPRPVVIPNQPVNWNADVTTFNAGNVNTGSLILAPAERADVVVDFSGIPAGTTLILYNDAPAPWPALDPHYDYYTGAPDNRAMGGADTTPIGFGPNTRTLMQIKVEGATDTSFSLAALQEAFNPSAPADPAGGVFRQSQESLVVGQGNMNPDGDPDFYEAFPFDGVDYSVLNTIYGTTFAASFPNWGVARINDKQISFKTVNPDGSVNPDVQTVTMKAKAIQDEQGETFDDYGRMRAALGLTLSEPGAGKVNFIVQTYSDPSTEVLAEEGIQVWKITHNGVDTHPIHFHLFDVQILNRVGWDGFIRLPDPTEMGWKETVRVSPLEDTIVALRPIKPALPFGIPSSVRPLNPATPLGDATELSMVDPTTGQAWATPNVNRIIDLGWEYVWHCHILSHEENDMMRPISYNPTVTVPDAPTGLATAASFSDGNVTLTWSDPTPAATALQAVSQAKNEIGFIIERCSGLDCVPSVQVGTALANATSYTETALSSDRYSYVVRAYNAAGTSIASNIVLTQSDSIIDGVCGSANGQNFSAVPTTGLCASGTASAVVNTDGVLTWSCTGINSVIDANCTAAIPTYAVSFIAGPNGSLSGTTPQSITYNLSTSTVTAVPAIGYHLVNWTEGATVISTNPDLTLNNIVAPHTYTANFAINTYLLNFTAGVGGSVVGSTPQTIDSFANATTVVAVADAGYRFVNWTDSIGNVVGSAADLTINSVTVANTYTANFINTFGVTLDRCVSGPTLVDAGATPTYSFTTSGFDVTAQVDGAPVALTAGSYTFTPVGANKVITASYTLNPEAASPYLKLSTGATIGDNVLQTAYDAAATGNSILIKGVDLAAGSLSANRNITVTLQGGYNDAFTASCATSSAQGGLTISSGTVIVDNLILR